MLPVVGTFHGESSQFAIFAPLNTDVRVPCCNIKDTETGKELPFMKVDLHERELPETHEVASE